MDNRFEIQSIVNNGVIHVDLVDLKSELEEAIKPYASLVVVPEDLRSGKYVKSKLTTLKNKVDKKRKEVNRQVNSQFNELEDIIQVAIDNLQDQIKPLDELNKLDKLVIEEVENNAPQACNDLIQGYMMFVHVNSEQSLALFKFMAENKIVYEIKETTKGE